MWKLADGDRIAFENYSDLLIARHFRQSIVCHAGAPATVEPVPERTQGLHWAVRPNAEPLEVGLTADAFARARPRSARARSRFASCASGSGAEPGELAEALLDGFRRERLMPHAGPLRAATRAGRAADRVAAGALAGGARAPTCVSLAYMRVRMEEPAARLLITLLDGTRDRAAIRAELQARAGLELSEHDLERNLRRADDVCSCWSPDTTGLRTPRRRSIPAGARRRRWRGCRRRGSRRGSARSRPRA